MTSQQTLPGPTRSRGRSSTVVLTCVGGQEIPDDGHEIQGFGVLRYLVSGSARARLATSRALNEILADTIVLYDLYRKCQWVVRGKGLHRLQQLLDEHAMQQLELVDFIIERIEILGGTAIRDPRRVAEVTTVTCPPDESNDLLVLLHWLIEVHQIIVDKLLATVDSSARVEPDRNHDPILKDAVRRHRHQAGVIATICEAPHAVVQ